MQIQPYLFFGGRADEAIAFYEGKLGARLVMRLRYKDNPDAAAPAPEALADKVMHARLDIGGNVVLLSDGHGAEGPSFQGFALTSAAASAEEVDRLFVALTEGGAVVQAPQKTFFSPRFAMAKDRFGVLWIMLVQ
ncbi:MAG TPA: VOC family protein [Methylocystis sp.]|nr:VOC family protein [Methylocystis sp.]